MRRIGLHALIISVSIHFIALGSIFFSPDFSLKHQPEQIEAKEIEIISHSEPRSRKRLQSQTPEKSTPLPYQEDILDRLLGSSRPAPLLNRERHTTAKIRSISLSHRTAPKELEKNPAYMDYYRKIREEIRENAYKNYNGRDRGEIYLNFSVAKNGSLRAIEFGSQSFAEESLRQVALYSIKESAPFPPFPEELNNHSELQFNVSIQFQNN